MKKCNIHGCPGKYEETKITHTVPHHGDVIVIDHVPAEVCSICGDVLFKVETVRRLEKLIKESKKPARTVPLYEYV